MPVSGTAGSSLLLGAVMTSDVGGGSAGATLSNTTTGSSRFAIGAVGGYWALVNGTAPYLSSIAVTPGVPTCLVAQIDFSVSGGLDRMRMWINPPLQRLQATPDIDITSAHVSRFSGVDWETQQGQTLDEISVNTAGGTWTAVDDLLGDRNLDTPLLLTDGTTLIHQLDTGFWRRLTPDIYGSYTSGFTAFSYIATMPTGYAPYGFASAVLPDGRVIVEGGEYNNGGAAETTLGAIYQPTTDTWQNVPPPTGWNTIGDAPSVVLPDGTFMLGNCCTHNPSLYDALFDATNLTWTSTGALQAEYNSEHGWTLLPGMMDSPAGSVLTVNAFFPITDGRISERYFPPPLGFWIPAGSTIVNLWDCLAGVSCEIGPAVLRPDGTVFATGATFSHPGHTAVYHTSLSDPYYASWTEGPDFPQDSSGGNLGVADGPAALLPNGNVLVDAGLGYYGAASFLEITLNNQWIFIPAPPTGGGTYTGQMVVLPSGQVLFTNQDHSIYVYTPSNQTFDPVWAPQISVACGQPVCLRVHALLENSISGLRFNGMSQGAMFGDDAQMATNYPLVRIIDGVSHIGDTGPRIYYCRTHDHSSMGVATGNLVVSTLFNCPGVPLLPYGYLQVVANGIPSKAIAVSIVP